MDPTKIDIRFERKTIMQDSAALVHYAQPRLMHACSHGKVLSLTLKCYISEHGQHAVAAMVAMPNKNYEHITVESEDMYTSVDLLVPKLEAVVKRQKAHMQDIKRESACRADKPFKSL